MNSANIINTTSTAVTAAAPLLQRKRTRYEKEDNFEGIRSIDDDINDIREGNYLKSSFYLTPYNAVDDENEIKNAELEILGYKDQLEFKKEDVAIKLVDLQIKKLEIEKQELKNEIDCLNIKIMFARGEIKKINHALMQLSVDLEKKKSELKKKYIQEHGDEDCDHEYYNQVNECEDELVKMLEHIKDLINKKYDFYGTIEVYNNDMEYKSVCLTYLEEKIANEKRNIWELYSKEKRELD